MIVTYVYAGSRLIGKTGSTTQVLLSDPLSVRLTLSDVGVVAGRQDHLPFGEEFAESGSQEKHHFTSYESDGESGTDYAVNRQYSQSVGRFMRVDPKAGSLSNPQSLDRYSYLANDPISFTDPLGLDWDWDGFLPGIGSSRGWAATWFFEWSGWFPGADRNLPSATEAVYAIPVKIPTIDPAVFQGQLTVDSNCEKAIYVPESGANGVAEHDWNYGVGLTNVPADFFATPRGLLKLQGGCKCTVSCSDGKDYEVSCVCSSFFGPLVPPGTVDLFQLTDNIGETRPKVADPREFADFKWVGKGAKYTPHTTIVPSLDGPSNTVSYTFD